jgi:phosphoglucosamine mutase
VAPAVLYELGAEVFEIGVEPNGFNINLEVGSTDTDALKKAVQTYRADIGIALDGDADRCIIIDEKGNEVDGDQLIGLIAEHWKARGQLSEAGVVTTVMSNLGLEQHLKSLDLSLERTKVGDRYVVERMREGGFNLGGEQSGHIVMSDYSTTGDGLMAALQVLAVMVERETPLSKIAHVFDPVPQKLVNVRFKSGAPLEEESVKDAIAAAEKSLGEKGRLVIRKSGTEPLIRVMAEATDAKLMHKAVESVAEAVRAVS